MLSNLNTEQRALAEYMSELSEQAYYAGWMHGLEHALWRAVTEGPFQYGVLQLTNEHVEALKRLSEGCGGWIRFDDEKEETFISLDEWRTGHYGRSNLRL